MLYYVHVKILSYRESSGILWSRNFCVRKQNTGSSLTCWTELWQLCNNDKTLQLYWRMSVWVFNIQVKQTESVFSKRFVWCQEHKSHLCKKSMWSIMSTCTSIIWLTPTACLPQQRLRNKQMCLCSQITEVQPAVRLWSPDLLWKKKKAHLCIVESNRSSTDRIPTKFTCFHSNEQGSNLQGEGRGLTFS